MAAVPTQPPVIDLYTPLAHKTGLAPGDNPTLAPTWTTGHARRLTAYKILAGYLNNAARWFLPTTPDNAAATQDRREYGDPALIVERIVTGLLGDRPELVVDGARVPPRPDLPDAPDPAPQDATTLEQRVADVARARWERDAADLVDTWATAVDGQPAARARETWLREWADQVGLWALLRLAETDACGLGDGVIVLAWSDREQRVVPRRYEPGFLFEVHDDDGGDGPLERVHVAWEYETRAPDGKIQKWVRRLTWELVPVAATYLNDDGEVPAELLTADDQVLLRPGDTVDPDTGRWVRRYPWHTDDQPGSDVACVYSEGTWRVRDLGPHSTDDFDATKAAWTARRVDLGIDFLPVIHLQGVDIGDDYGRSCLALIAQLLDEISAQDTDVAGAAALAAGPMVAVSDAMGMDGPIRVKPGTGLKLGPEGRMAVLDLSKGLSESRATLDALLDRLSVNAQIPAEYLGRVADTKVLSGVAIALRFGPFRSLIEGMRLQHTPKWAEIPAMVQKLAMAAGPDRGGLDPAPVLPARVVPGPFLPSDLSGLITDVAKAREAQIISEEQAVSLLVAGGMSIEDAAAEVARIREADPERAKLLFEATGNDDAAAAWAGVDPADAPPDPDLGTGGGR